MALVPTETQESIAFASKLLEAEDAGLLTYCHTPNEGYIDIEKLPAWLRAKVKRARAIQKDMGLRRGWPDYTVFAGGRVFAIEMKGRDAPVGDPWGVRIASHALRADQAERLEALSRQGVRCRACRGAQEAWAWLEGELGQLSSP